MHSEVVSDFGIFDSKILGTQQSFRSLIISKLIVSSVPKWTGKSFWNGIVSLIQSTQSL